TRFSVSTSYGPGSTSGKGQGISLGTSLSPAQADPSPFGALSATGLTGIGQPSQNPEKSPAVAEAKCLELNPHCGGTPLARASSLRRSPSARHCARGQSHQLAILDTGCWTNDCARGANALRMGR